MFARNHEIALSRDRVSDAEQIGMAGELALIAVVVRVEIARHGQAQVLGHASDRADDQGGAHRDPFSGAVRLPIHDLHLLEDQSCQTVLLHDRVDRRMERNHLEQVLRARFL